MANFTFSRVIEIMRRVIARRNQTDTLSTDVELLNYIGEFMRDLMPQETKNFENLATYEFDTIADTEEYDFNSGDGADINGIVFENIGPIAYCDEQLMNWYQDPSIFYDKWGFNTDVTTVTTSQPQDVLFYNDAFVLKNRPDDTYRIRIFGYARNADYTTESTSSTIEAETANAGIPENYWGRYVAYGASLDYMYDFGYDPQRIQVVELRYKHYKSLIQSRTFNQFMQETPLQRF